MTRLTVPASLAFLLAAAAVLPPRPATADTRRVAVVVGHNTGSSGEVPLHYAEDDAGKFADVLVDLGDVAPSELFLVQGKGKTAVADALTRATKAVRAVRTAPDDRVVLLFFYSGHSDEHALELGGDRFTYADLKAALAASGADVRIAIVDGCKSGALVQTKGGKPGPSFELGLDDQLSSSGEAMLTSSAANEQALESSEVRGSFFTHHLVSGMRGAADTSGDGRVTLSEAYDYAFNRTVSSSASAGAEPQHPNYDYRLSGRGELVLTELGGRNAALRLPEGFSRALVIQIKRDQIIAELTRADTRTVALAPGEYAVRLWKDSAQSAGRITARAGAITDVTWKQLDAVGAAGGKAAKGGVDDPEALSPAAQVEWDDKVLAVGDDVDVVIDGRTTTAGGALYVGKYRRKVKADEFLRLAGRDNLASAVSQRRGLKLGLMAVGAAVMLGGFVYGAVGERCDPPVGNPDFANCIDRHGTALQTGVLVGFGGSGLILLGAFLPNRRPSLDTLRRIADEYDTNLRQRLHAGRQPPGLAANLRLSPVVSADGGALILSGRF